MGASRGGAAEGRHLQSGIGAAEDRYEGSNGRGESKQCGGDGAEAAVILEEAGGMCAPGAVDRCFVMQKDWSLRWPPLAWNWIAKGTSPFADVNTLTGVFFLLRGRYLKGNDY